MLKVLYCSLLEQQRALALELFVVVQCNCITSQYSNNNLFLCLP